MLRGSPWARVALVLVTALHLSCGGAPTAPRRLSDVGRETASAAARAYGAEEPQNHPPNLVLRTTPPADPSTSPPTISGEAPLAVRFNLCRSDDPDPGDSLNYQFSFGDSGRPPFNPDGSFAPDFDHFCRTEHVYETPGTYTATVSVTDKHLDDQSQQVVAFARRTQSLTIDVARPGLTQPVVSPPVPSPSPSASPTPTPRLVITIVTNGGSMSYSPNPAVARTGQRIVWVNADGVTHTATADGGAFDTGFVAPGATSGGVSLPTGTFPYHCTIHLSMVATLIVVP